MIKHQALAQFFGVFAFDVIDAGMRGIAVQDAIMGDQFVGVGDGREHFRDRSRIAGPDHAATQGQAERGHRRMMAGRKHVEPEPLVPEAARQRNQLEGIPEIRPALGKDLRIIGNARLQDRQQRGVGIQAQVSALAGIEVCREEQSLQAADVIHVRMGQVDGPWRRTVVIQVGGQCIGAAIDHQQRLPVALDHRRRRTQLDRVRVADAKKPQGELQGRSPRA